TLMLVLLLFFLSRYAALRDLHSFPTRRSSDLGNFELNVFKPVMIHNLLHSIRLIHDACHGFVEYCIAGLGVNREQIEHHLRDSRSEEHTSELQSPYDLVCRLLLEKKK